jgi:hypothetical protein
LAQCDKRSFGGEFLKVGENAESNQKPARVNRDSEFVVIRSSFRDGAQHETRNLEIPGSMLRIAPE